MAKARNNEMLIVAMIILYFNIYNPLLKPGIAIGGTILIVISLIYMMNNFSSLTKYLKYYKRELTLSAFIIIYVFFVCSMNGEDSSIANRLLLWVITSTVVPFFLIRAVLLRNREIAFWDLIIEVGFIASIISCIALFYPPFNDFLRNIQMEIDTSGGVLENQLDFRCFGFAFYLTSRYGYVQGLLAALCLLRFDSHHKRYAFYFLTLFLSVIINARTGLFPVALTISYLILKSAVRIRIITLAMIAMGGGIAVFAIVQVFNNFPDLSDFFMDFVDQLNLIFIEGEVEDSSYSKMLFFPDSITGFVFGEGRRASGVLASSDIGYVNQIFYGGLIFAGSLLIYELMLYIKIVKWSKDWVWPTIFFVSMLVFNYKGAWFSDYLSAFVRLWILYYYVLVHNRIYPCKRIRLT